MEQTSMAKTQKTTFSRTTTISTIIRSEPSIIWSLLTNTENFSKWNSTIVSMQGKIQKGEKIKLQSTLESNRIFTLKVKELIPNEKMIWGGIMGERVYRLSNLGNNTLFEMTEKIGSLMFPLFASKIPSFDKSFEKFSQDLKKEAELVYNPKK